jgi:hypothetical protein
MSIWDEFRVAGQQYEEIFIALRWLRFGEKFGIIKLMLVVGGGGAA